MLKRIFCSRTVAVFCGSVLFLLSSIHGIPSFPEAQGGGAQSVGGRGGRVIEVTTLNESGTGSLREACLATGARIVVFRVAGVINLTRDLDINNPNITIAGQTAPGGIALFLGTNHNTVRAFNINTHDVVIRYLRIWGDYAINQNPGSNPGPCGPMIWSNAPNVVVDHCTILWTTTMCLSAYTGPGNFTWSWNLLGENIFSTSGAGQSTPVLVASYNSSGAYDPTLTSNADLHHNLIVSGNHRNPLVCGSGRIINNEIYNFTAGTIIDGGGTGGSSFDLIGNYFKPGPFELYAAMYEIMADRGISQLYISNNKSSWNKSGRGIVTGDEADGGWSKIAAGSTAYQGEPIPSLTPLPATYKRTSRLPSPGYDIVPDPVSNLEGLLTAAGGVGSSRRLDSLGRWVNLRDNAETRIVNYVLAGSGPISPPNSVAAINGGLPPLSSGTPYVDSDHDGMPNAWERQYGLNVNSAVDASQDKDGDGYTNVEEFLNNSIPGTTAITAQTRPIQSFSSIVKATPSYPGVAFEYSVANPGIISINIYNAKGEKINNLLNTNQDAGDYNVYWNGKDMRGREAPQGIYFVKVRQKDRTSAKKFYFKQ